MINFNILKFNNTSSYTVDMSNTHHSRLVPTSDVNNASQI